MLIYKKNYPQGALKVTNQSEHKQAILDQFTKQAVPFMKKLGHADESAFQFYRDVTGVTSRDTVLDVACGPGLVACAFAVVARKVTGIDLTPAMIEQAKKLEEKKRLANMIWQVGDVLPLPYAEASFSLVTTRYSFHHFLEPPGGFPGNGPGLRPGGYHHGGGRGAAAGEGCSLQSDGKTAG